MELNKQVDKDFYKWSNYMDKERWISYYYQILLIHKISHDCLSVLEVGAGLDINKKHIVEYIPTLSYKTLDIADDLEPDYIGSVHKIPLPDESFDAVVAFEILEHIPFEEFENSLEEIKRVARKRVVISLPHFGPPVKLLLKIPFFPEIRFALKIPYLRKHIFNGQHYWEIGKRGYPIKKIRTIIAKYFDIEYDFIPFENQYHHFFVLKKRELNKKLHK